jgi:catechol 2,3-dioxygenase-like lactoylglutathione lyase family enzyme
VPDLERSRRFFVDVLGLGVVNGIELHRPEHDALWGLEGSRRSSLVLAARDFLVELVEYAEPVGRSWPHGYRISDQGLLNVAFAFRSRRDLAMAYQRCKRAGHEGNSRPLSLGAWTVVYVNDDQGFSVELLHVATWYAGRMGFTPSRTPRFAPFLGRRAPRRSRSAARVG